MTDTPSAPPRELFTVHVRRVRAEKSADHVAWNAERQALELAKFLPRAHDALVKLIGEDWVERATNPLTARIHTETETITGILHVDEVLLYVKSAYPYDTAESVSVARDCTRRYCTHTREPVLVPVHSVEDIADALDLREPVHGNGQFERGRLCNGQSVTVERPAELYAPNSTEVALLTAVRDFVHMHAGELLR